MVKKEMKPAWNLGTLFLVRINNLFKYLDNASVRVNSGQLAYLPYYYAILLQIYNTMKPYISEERREKIDFLFRCYLIASSLGKILLAVNLLNKIQDELNDEFATNEFFVKLSEKITFEDIQKILIRK